MAAAVGRPVFATTGLELSGRQKRLLMDLQGALVQEWTSQVTWGARCEDVERR